MPYGVHAYLTKDMGRNENGVGATNNAEVVDSSSLDAATHWRDVEIRRNFAVEPEIYDGTWTSCEKWKMESRKRVRK